MIYEDYSIFTVGPVKMPQSILQIGAKQTPYFRNQQFSDVMLRCESLLIKMVNAPKGSRVVFLTASGTAAMEATVMNLFDEKDKALVINGGTFGNRFVSLCRSHNVPHSNLEVEQDNLSDIENRIDGREFNSLIINGHETSIGNLYDLDAVGNFCKNNGLLHVVDAISVFATDRLDMQEQHIDCTIVSSHKALALPPGLSMIILNPKAIDRLKDINVHYFDFKNYLKNGERGQTPYTPAVTIVLQLLQRLQDIENLGGIEASIENARDVATYFREKIKNLPFDFYSKHMANALTTLTPTDGKGAKEVLNELENKYKIIVCPNGGELADKIFRVSHMGIMTKEYTDILISALEKISV